MPRFVGCLDIAADAPCVADEIQYFGEGDNIRFNISVDYIAGGPIGEQQNLRLVGLSRDSNVLINCLNEDLSSCTVRPNLPQAMKDRIEFRRDESDPWFDVEINITNAVTNDNGVYLALMHALDTSGTGTVTTSISTITVSVIPTSREFFCAHNLF